MGTITEKIVEVLEEADGPLTNKEISIKIYGEVRSIYDQLQSLRHSWNAIEKVERGKYTIKE